MDSLRRCIAALAITVAALAGSTACTTVPGGVGSSPTAAEQAGDADQTVAEGCALVQDTITDATREFEDAAAKDPAAVVEAMQAAAGKLHDAASAVTNDEVAAILPDLEDMFATVADVMQAIVEGDTSKVQDLAALGESFQQTSERFQELCVP
ncbi:hypothetical protein [Microbacterium sp. P5_E9]